MSAIHKVFFRCGHGTCCVLCCMLQGIPAVHRGWVWWRLSGAAEAAAADPGHYQACLAAGSSSTAVKQVCEHAPAVVLLLSMLP